MSILIGFLYVIEVLACLLLALVVMLQKPKEGGLGGAIAGGMGEAVFGADASNVLIKVTIWLGAIFLANTLLLARLTSKVSNSVTDGISEAPVEQQQPALPQGGDVAPAPAPAPAPEAPAQPSMEEPAPAAPAEEQPEAAMEEPVGEPIEPTENTANNPEIDKIFSTIRYSVISGLAKLANQSTTVEYDTLKKILAIVDKPVESRANNK